MTVEIDGANNIIKTNTISEVTSANGVTIDGLSIKDSKLVTADSVIEANMSANSVDSDSYVDGSIDGVHLSSNVITGQTALTSVANDDLVLLSDTSGSAALKKMTVANLVANAGGGKLLQVVSSTKTDTFTTSDTSFTDITGLGANITPTSSSSKVYVVVSIQGSQDIGSNRVNARLLRESTAIAVGASAGNRVQASVGLTSDHADLIASASASVLDSPNTSSQITYKMQIANTAGGGLCYVNRTENDSNDSGMPRCASTITVMEIGA